MNSEQEIDRLKQKMQQKRLDFDNCDSVLKQLDRLCGAQQGAVTRLSQAANPDQNKIEAARDVLAIRTKDRDTCSRNYYKIADEIKDINLELTRLQQQEQPSSSRRFGR